MLRALMQRRPSVQAQLMDLMQRHDQTQLPNHKNKESTRHIRNLHIALLAGLTVNNEHFQQLGVSRAGRSGHRNAGDSLTDAHVYFDIDRANYYPIANFFRTVNNEKYRLGIKDGQEICGQIAEFCLASYENTVTARQMNKCKAAIAAMLNRPKGFLALNQYHMRELLLIEIIARQLKIIDGGPDSQVIGQDIQLTLNWIDSVLSSTEFEDIGIGGQLKGISSARPVEHPMTDALFYATLPVHVYDQSQSASDMLSTFNSVFIELRNTLIETSVMLSVDQWLEQRSANFAETVNSLGSMRVILIQKGVSEIKMKAHLNHIPYERLCDGIAYYANSEEFVTGINAMNGHLNDGILNINSEA